MQTNINLRNATLEGYGMEINTRKTKVIVAHKVKIGIDGEDVE